MGWGEFDKLEIMTDTGDLLVQGPYRPGTDENQKILGSIVIGFLIIQDDSNKNPTVVLDGVVEVDPTTATTRDDGAYEWSILVPADKVRAAGGVGIGIQAGKTTRAIGTAVQVTQYMPADPSVPPGVTMFTWCVGRDVTKDKEEA
jgi:hypothetical protein